MTTYNRQDTYRSIGRASAMKAECSGSSPDKLIVMALHDTRAVTPNELKAEGSSIKVERLKPGKVARGKSARIIAQANWANVLGKVGFSVLLGTSEASSIGQGFCFASACTTGQGERRNLNVTRRQEETPQEVKGVSGGQESKMRMGTNQRVRGEQVGIARMSPTPHRVGDTPHASLDVSL